MLKLLIQSNLIYQRKKKMEKKAFLLIISIVRTVLKIFPQNYFLMKKIIRLMH